ncbi:MAG: response regulator [Rhodospirillaceae bacterium]
MGRVGGSIVVADDDARIRKVLDHYLSKEGFTVIQANSGKDLRTVMTEREVDLVLLDLDLGDEDGLMISKELSQRDNLGVIIITGKGDVVDRVVGLEMGADDYLPKPFNLRELLARVKSVLRRTQNPAADAGKKDTELPKVVSIRFGDWILDPESRQLMKTDGSEVDLTSAEFSLLHALAQKPNRVMTRDQLLDHTTGRKWTPYDRSIDTLVGRLRSKIEPTKGKTTYIKSVRGVGYVLSVSDGK